MIENYINSSPKSPQELNFLFAFIKFHKNSVQIFVNGLLMCDK